MAICKKCGKPIIWEHEGVDPKEGWRPYDVEEINFGIRTLHFNTCKPNDSKVFESLRKLKDIKRLRKGEAIQIGEEEFI